MATRFLISLYFSFPDKESAQQNDAAKPLFEIKGVESVFYINELYVDFHYDKIKSISRGIHNKLISKLNQLNINLYLWGEPNKALDYKIKPKKVKPQFRNYIENPQLINDKLKKIKQYVKNPHRIKKKILSYFKI